MCLNQLDGARLLYIISWLRTAERSSLLAKVFFFRLFSLDLVDA